MVGVRPHTHRLSVVGSMNAQALKNEAKKANGYPVNTRVKLKADAIQRFLRSAGSAQAPANDLGGQGPAGGNAASGQRPRSGDQRRGQSRKQATRPNAQPSRPAVSKFRSTVPKAVLVDQGDVPVNRVVEISGPLSKMEPDSHFEGDSLVFTGSEFLTQVVIPPALGGVTTHLTAGSALAMYPLNPRYIEGLRVSKTLSQFDQFRLVRLAVEYVPVCAATQPGGLIAFCVNTAEENPSLLGGAQSLRDGMSRPGSAAFNVFSRTAAYLNQQQQEWYFTSITDDVNLTMPGTYILMLGTDINNDSTDTLPLGLLWMHYEIHVRSPSIEVPKPLQYFSQSASVAFPVTARSAGDVVTISSSLIGPPWNTHGVIGRFLVVSIDDAGYGSNLSWRTWRIEKNGQVVTISPGMVVYFRLDHTGLFYVFYPSLADAIAANNAADAEIGGSFVYAASVPAGSGNPGFKIWTMIGTPVGGDG